MLNTFLNNFPISKLIQEAESLEIGKEKEYFTSYQEFINYFKAIQGSISRHHVVIGISFTYSWMPTILEIATDHLDEATEILNKAKSGSSLGKPELEILKKCFNNSLVGSSKLLHFIDPERFPIWDSRVCRYLMGRKPHSYLVEDVDHYLAYLAYCEQLIKSDGIDELQKRVKEKVGPEVSKMRTIELIFFLKGQRPATVAAENTVAKSKS